MSKYNTARLQGCNQTVQVFVLQMYFVLEALNGHNHPLSCQDNQGASGQIPVPGCTTVGIIVTKQSQTLWLSLDLSTVTRPSSVSGRRICELRSC